MRAERLVSELLILERRGRATTAELADELEVSRRTILRDMESLQAAGVPIYSSRGVGGGFRLVDGYESGLEDPETWRPAGSRTPSRHRARVALSPEASRRAALRGRPGPLRIQRSAKTDRRGWLIATFRLRSVEAGAADVLALGPDIEVLEPERLRIAVARQARAIAALYDGS